VETTRAGSGLALVLKTSSLEEVGIRRQGMGANGAIHRTVQSGEEMEKEKEIDFLEVIRELQRQKIRFLIIGRRAVILYGAPVLTADHDLWIHPADKRQCLSVLSEDLGFEISHPPDTRRPIVTAYSGLRKYDLFFHRRITNTENDGIDFDACYKEATILEDETEKIRFRIPSIDDLIRLKKIREPNVKDEQDIAYLLKAKRLFRK
jgi:hypothetical protein